MEPSSTSASPTLDPVLPPAEVAFERRGHSGVVILNRPRAVNALNHAMVAAVDTQLRLWAEDPDVEHVVITGAGERGLCSGGDVVAMYRDMVAGERASHDFFRAEFRMNSLIFGYPKPIVAVQDGLVLGGGVGISAHASHRVVTETTRMGMPEVTIGYVPDVGGTWLLGHAGAAGVHAVMTGDHVGPGDAIHLGLSDAFVPAAQLPEFLRFLETETADDAVARFAVQAPAALLAAADGSDGAAAWVEECYAGALSGDASAAVILSRLETHPHEEARAAADTILGKCPRSVAVGLEAVRRHAQSSLDEALRDEFRVAVRCLASHDMREGIRAQVIDKDRNPRWEHASLSDVSQELVLGYFEPFQPGETDGGDLEL
ncbi:MULTISPECIES: 3-hydroxyisobutyryl-CoA hydrolase [Arthrobacter]|uniref:3-hydroxyisobutyryl-CoA hydrolase n=2 Tax=Arthrobacter TaxID=1663 RepID=A0ABU9KIW8_9MICC|nr:3-hydroxyisobutyryl-CoA hydrolase [Arthrobacter sp. YJM1]MDP5226463.1 3-hydroxyisobutyryl-CoA hydrolase [Arthrobacter sp. YJM1]